MLSKKERAQEHGDLPEEDYGNGIAFAENAWGASPEKDNKASRKGAVIFSCAVLAVCFVLALSIAQLFLPLWLSLVVGLVIGVLGILSVHITLQWERAVVLRFGKLDRVVGPGIYFTVPIVEYTTLRVDQRMRCTFFSGEQILTADLVPVDVDAVFFWTVWDARKACTEVENYLYSVSRTAQACMRDVIGSMEIEEMATRRSQIDQEIRDQIALVTDPWGISVASVKIRNIIVPKDLQDALSKAAQAQRERDARVILAEVEKDISAMLVEAADVYDQNDHAIQLRAMHAVNDSVKDRGGVVVVPSSLGDSFGSTADFLKHLK